MTLETRDGRDRGESAGLPADMHNAKGLEFPT